MSINPKELLAPEEEKFHIQAEAVNFDEQVKVLNHYDTFAIIDRWGNVYPSAKKSQGVFHQGMRFLNRLELLFNNNKPLLLSSSIKENNDFLSVDLTNPKGLLNCDPHENTLHISRSIFFCGTVFIMSS